MRLWIKICGLTSAEAVAAAVAAGADALGFVFHATSPRNLTPSKAAALARAIPGSVLRVAVTRRATQAQIDAIIAEFATDLLQADAADLGSLMLPSGIGRLPVLRSGAAVPAQLPVRCLYEGADSGSGIRADWDAAAALARRTELVLAGGLSAANVGAAVAAVRPFGVDVSSGVERVAGQKEAGLIHAFIAAARAAEQY